MKVACFPSLCVMPEFRQAAEAVLEAIRKVLRSLERSPFSFRKAGTDSPFLCELVIPFGTSGYVAL